MSSDSRDVEQEFEPMSPEEHQEQTASDCEEVAKMITNLAESVRRGNLLEFEAFFWRGGTPEGDSKIQDLRQRLILRYSVRQERVQATAVANAGKAEDNRS